jgi:hypothetical protein
MPHAQQTLQHVRDAEGFAARADGAQQAIESLALAIRSLTAGLERAEREIQELKRGGT